MLYTLLRIRGLVHPSQPPCAATARAVARSAGSATLGFARIRRELSTRCELTARCALTARRELTV